MLDLGFPDDRDRLDPAVRVVREARLVVGRVDRLVMVEEQEGVIKHGAAESYDKLAELVTSASTPR